MISFGVTAILGLVGGILGWVHVKAIDEWRRTAWRKPNFEYPLPDRSGDVRLRAVVLIIFAGGTGMAGFLVHLVALVGQ
jgi:hypothetical protein